MPIHLQCGEMALGATYWSIYLMKKSFIKSSLWKNYTCSHFPLFTLHTDIVFQAARYRLKYCLKGLLNPKPTKKSYSRGDLALCPKVLGSNRAVSRVTRFALFSFLIGAFHKKTEHFTIAHFRLLAYR